MLAVLLAILTFAQIRPQPALDEVVSRPMRAQVLDREGHPLRVSYAEQWNFNERTPLSEVPPFLISAVVAAEDQNFYSHHGVDWTGRLAGAWLNLKKFRTVRGSSTISEQVVRMLYPRPRTLWSKWIEGFEAAALERKNGKNRVLEFYLNQVPFNERRRGIVQAARGFFGRDISTLNKAEMLALAAMIKNPARMGRGHLLLGERLNRTPLISNEEWNDIRATKLKFESADLQIEAPHFIAFAETQSTDNPIKTTLHPGLQITAQKLLDEVLRSDREHILNNGAVILADHQTNEVLAWAVGHGENGMASAYNAALIPRQPGSSLKPFLYALAFEQGLSPDTAIEDAALTEAVGAGLHNYRNYSRVFYGWISAREALANSLNTPAVRVLRKVGVSTFLGTLHRLHLDALNQPDWFYGDGLALGNGEVPLWQMVQAYATLARGGIFKPLKISAAQTDAHGEKVFSSRAARAVSQILSDGHARRLEFGRGGNLEFPVQAAVKTGTSTDFRDAWAFAYNYKYVVGVWLGNLDNRPTKGLSGSTSPMLIARALINQALRGYETHKLIGTERILTGMPKLESDDKPFRISKPANGTHMAIDPRVPRSSQQFTFEVEGLNGSGPVIWELDGLPLRAVGGTQAHWTLERGRHEITARHGEEQQKRVFYVR